MDEQDVVHKCGEWAIGLKKEGAPDTWMNLVNIMLKYSHKGTNITRFHLCVRSP